MNILIVKLSAIGDVIHTLPVLNAIRKQYPNAHITWLAEEAACSLVEGHSALDRVLVSKRKRWIKDISGPLWLKSIKEAYLFIKEVRNTRYDLIIDFQQLLKSGVLVGLSRGYRKIGYDRGMEHMEHSYVFLNERVPPVDMNIHAIMRQMMLLNVLGIHEKEITYKLPVQEQNRQTANELLRKHGVKESGLLVAINPVAKWKTKLWSDMKFSMLADRLIRQYGVQLVFTGGPEDQQTIQNIISGMRENAANLAGKTSLKTLAAIYEKIAFLVSTDTGPMHLGAAVGKPVVAIFGPTAPWRTGPFGPGHQVIRAGLKCSPCFKRQCNTMKCMEQISVQDVLDGVRRVFER
ncbi:lipopolysaccharide heptosyltransferase II [Desulfonema magnum]|uniref:lipopolysaccharide heptosyltransferase II n=1 Tax=Desulfonema magnum TaxID=45655 RepID=A0A975BQ09_9BACT|nr:lipopolysaccharide heptosyltransferase II [Desulfonema magnum]QTA89450.1 Lipopolysaccharide heptosyltransferase II [Desulfonema magnum]